MQLVCQLLSLQLACCQGNHTMVKTTHCLTSTILYLALISHIPTADLNYIVFALLVLTSQDKFQYEDFSNQLLIV